MKKLCIVPFTRTEYSLLDAIDKNVYEIVALVSPMGIGLEKNDVCILRNESPSGYEFSNNVESSLDAGDTIIISNVDKNMKVMFTFAFDALVSSAKKGKEILCFLELDDSQRSIIESLCEIHNSVIRYFSPKINELEYENNIQLLSWDIPIFAVGEMLPDCDSFDVFLDIVKLFESEGKRVLGFSENPYTMFLGYTCIKFDAPNLLNNQVTRINSLFSQFIDECRPDVIVIHLPKPFMRYNDTNCFDNGLINFAISQAIKIDGCVLCGYSGLPVRGFWKDYMSEIEHKYGYPIMMVHISNRTVDSTSASGISPLRLPLSVVSEELDQLRENETCYFYNHKLSNVENCNELFEEYFDLPFGVI